MDRIASCRSAGVATSTAASAASNESCGDKQEQESNNRDSAFPFPWPHKEQHKRESGSAGRGPEEAFLLILGARCRGRVDSKCRGLCGSIADRDRGWVQTARRHVTDAG